MVQAATAYTVNTHSMAKLPLTLQSSYRSDTRTQGKFNMALESPETIDLAEQRAELERVLGSPSFVRAPTLANLLSYLCERYFAGESGQIKEYSIGVEVFRRGESFDQDADS